jgi:protein-S-isoprenylcysteine O-methyltransferase Ste14
VAVSRARPLDKAVYGLLFAGVLPALLVAWAAGSADAVHLRPLQSAWGGGLLAAVGVALSLAGMQALWVHGGGLPMNAFPPPVYVSRGAFAVVAHPIYTGFVAACAGVSIAAGSSSGLWLVTPLVALGCAALVLGYERLDLRARFGPVATSPWLSLPPDSIERPSAAQRLAAWGLVLLPWAAAYEAIVWLGVPHDARSSALPFESSLPVVEWTEAVYASAYAGVALAPWAARTCRDLRRFMVAGLLSMAVVFPMYLALPLIAPPRPFSPHSPLGVLLSFERAWDSAAAAFPSFHAVWALLAARLYAASRPRFTPVAWGWALAVSVSCVTTGMHTILDVVAAFAVVACLTHAALLWRWARVFAERTANSWREWNFGPVRLINHGVYAGLGSFFAFAIVALLVGPGHAAAVGVAGLGALVGSALWAQFIEGSVRLSRPYGYFGGLLGICMGALAAPLLDVPIWQMLGAACVAGPWVQSMGRLRCLVQGCCHGSPAPDDVGIRYDHPRSRVTRLSDLGGVPIHPTPLYSILWNVVIATAMTRLWLVHAQLHLIGGLYLVLMGMGRFVEEAYRGEPQTAVLARLRLYQWVSVAAIAIGALITAIGRSGPAPPIDFDAGVLLPALAYGILVSFAMGVDFPRSNARFSRLA